MRCNHFDAGTCRSCSLLPQPYERQLAGKAEAIAATLSPVPGADEIAWLAPASSPQKGFRTSAKLVVGGTRRRPTLGILGPDRRGIDLPGCPIQHPAINRAAPGLKRFIRSLDLTPYDVPTKRGELKNILITVGAGEQLMIRFVLRTRERVSDIRSALPLLRNLVPSAHVVTANIHPTHEAVVEGPDEIILTRARTLPLNVEGLELVVIAAVVFGGVSVFGGRGSIWGSVCGVLTIGVLNYALRLNRIPEVILVLVTGLLLIGSVVAPSLVDAIRQRLAHRADARTPRVSVAPGAASA